MWRSLRIMIRTVWVERCLWKVTGGVLREKGKRNIWESIANSLNRSVAEANKEMGQWLEKWGQESFILVADIMACLCAGNNPVESEKLIMQERIGERRVIWKPPKELLRLFRLFTLGIPYPNRDIYYIIMILSCQIMASSPIGSLSPIISISVSSVVVYYPFTQDTGVAGHILYGTWTISCASLFVQIGPRESRIGLPDLVHEAIQANFPLQHQVPYWNKLGLTMRARDK